MSIVTKFSATSPEVTGAKLGKFETGIKSVTTVNGSKYRPGVWSKDMFEIETEDGVYISTYDFTNYLNKRVEASTNKDKSDIEWRWINFVRAVSEPRFIKLEDALNKAIPAKLCYVYKIEIGPEIYVGFTSKHPQDRIEKHIEKSKNNAMQKVNKALRKWGYQHTWEVIGKYENEILALLAEKTQIVKLNATLNETEGGEGDDFNIVKQQCEMGGNIVESIFYVHDKRKILDR